MKVRPEPHKLLAALIRLFEAPSYTDIPGVDLVDFGKEKVYQLAFSVKKEAQTFAETIDNVRAALKLKDTHYLVLPDQVADMVKAVEMRQPGPPSSKHGPYCRVYERKPNPTGPGEVRVFCGELHGHKGPHFFARCV